MKYKVTLNNKTYEVEVDSEKAMLVDEYEAYVPAAPAAPAAPIPAASEKTAPAAAAPDAAVSGETVNAPMPGNILDVRVSAGESVKAGQILIILEAMKMENEIVAPRDCVISQVYTSKGSTVDTGTPLVSIA